MPGQQDEQIPSVENHWRRHSIFHFAEVHVFAHRRGPAVTGREKELAALLGLFEFPGERVFASAASDDEDVHGGMIGGKFE